MSRTTCCFFWCFIRLADSNCLVFRKAFFKLRGPLTPLQFNIDGIIKE